MARQAWRKKNVQFYLQLSNCHIQPAVNSLVSGHPRGIEKKCPLVELSAYENCSHKRTPKKNWVDVRLQESQLAGVITFQLGSHK